MAARRTEGSGCGGWLIWLLIIFGSWAYNEATIWYHSWPFEPVLIAAALDCQATAPRETVLRPYRTGKVLMLDGESGKLSLLFPQLDASVRASDAQDVSTLVCFSEYKTRVGTYTDGAAAYRVDYQIWLVDFKTKQLIGRTSLSGGSPPGTKRGGGSASGAPPDGELLEWLKGLPERSI